MNKHTIFNLVQDMIVALLFHSQLVRTANRSRRTSCATMRSCLLLPMAPARGASCEAAGRLLEANIFWQQQGLQRNWISVVALGTKITAAPLRAGQPDDVVHHVAGCARRVLCVCGLAVASGAGLVLRVAAV
jgi:hypothetical protein